MTPIPNSLTPEFVTARLRQNGQIKKLDELANRGIILNTWQANHLLLDGDRQIGKTFLSYVKVAEMFSSRASYQTISIHDDLSIFDPDATTSDRKRRWIKGLFDFMTTFYGDKFNITYVKGIVAIYPIKTQPNKRWWLWLYSNQQVTKILQ